MNEISQNSQMDEMSIPDKHAIDTMPDAFAIISGGSNYPQIEGTVYFFGVHGGTVVTARIKGLPDNENGNFYGFHIHEGKSCGNESLGELFKSTGNHYNPQNVSHPEHAGDLPVLMGNNGLAWCEVYTSRFYPEDVIGKTVVIHDMADDYKSQPSGDSGEKIACGEIQEMKAEAF